MFTIHTGNQISAANGRWTFGNHVAEQFDAHVERSIPYYHDGHALVVKISDYFLRPHSICYDLGCSTGTLLARLHEHHQGRRVEFLGIDNQEQMVAKAKVKNQHANDISFICADVSTMDFSSADFIVSYYTSHFIDLTKRRDLFAKVFEALRPGGAFVLFEKTTSDIGSLQDMYVTLYNDFKLSQGFTADEIMAKTRSLKGVLQPLSAKENRKLLKRSGFSRIDSIFRYLCFEGFLAVKTK